MKASSIFSPRKYVKFSVWGPAYLEALSLGHVKKTAAAMANIEFATVVNRRKTDPDFVRREEIALNMGTAKLVNIAMSRIQDPVNPADGLLRHLLAHRGISSTQTIELTGKDGKPIEVDHDHKHSHTHTHQFPIDRFSLEAKKVILAELERIAREDGIIESGNAGASDSSGDIRDAEYVEVGSSGSSSLKQLSQTVSVLADDNDKGEDDGD